MPTSVDEGVGSRGGNVRTLDEARDVQVEVKAKRDWAGAIDEQIARTLLATGAFHADDLDELCVPPEHANTKGLRIGSFSQRKLMESTGVYRTVSHAAANARKAPVYRITKKGRRELSKLVGVSAEGAREPGPMPDVAPDGHRASARCTDSGDNGAGVSESVRPEEVPTVDLESASAASPETLSLLPEPDPEAWAA